jgi:hypothetical protein
MKQSTIFVILFLLLPLSINPITISNANARTNKQHSSVVAALACIDQMAPIIKNRQKDGKDVSCDIPVSLSEKDLDELFKAAARSASTNEKLRGAAEKYSASLAKTLTNFRAANCLIKLRIKRSQIIEALSQAKTVVQLADQLADCDITTKKHKIQKLKFAFSPRIHMENGCISKFALNMGKVDANCRVCYFNRLYLSTKLVALWANHTADNIRPPLNRILGESCNTRR